MKRNHFFHKLKHPSAALLFACILTGCQSFPLQQSIRTGNTAAALTLIQKGKDIDKPDNLGKTPLICAEERGDSTIAQALIDKGVDVNQTDFNGTTPLLCPTD